MVRAPYPEPGFFMAQKLFFPILSKTIFQFISYLLDYEGIPLKEMKKLSQN